MKDIVLISVGQRRKTGDVVVTELFRSCRTQALFAQCCRPLECLRSCQIDPGMFQFAISLPNRFSPSPHIRTRPAAGFPSLAVTGNATDLMRRG
ncbi:hypothetical protein SKAU_G00189840 [Synaphobranchus kaupii]|uniref:Uncharacterized protein n=1 Tax=Synaphobranchus kaupii TaxID=118154 RepID=A0A9Q1FD82_SYNKA|nr:hypothetical protein SKAU_G00189840 [Synaphobranchus kaupii]